MKKFIYDQTIDKNNICNMETEVATIIENIVKGRNTVIFAPRNYGKTSIIQNIVIPDFKDMHKKTFVFFADFLGVDTMDAISNRLRHAFEKAFSETFPIKSIVENTKEYLKGMNAQIQIDTLTGVPALSFGTGKNARDYSVEEIFSMIKGLGIPSLIVLDEFQDIANIKSADALFRSAFQSLNIPMIVMGSQRQLLSELFTLSKSPLASFGVDVIFEPIEYEKYHDYIAERFAINNIVISAEVTKHIQQLMDRVPEPINMLCDFILDTAITECVSHVESIDFVNGCLDKLLRVKRKRFEYTLYNLSSSEQKILLEIAKGNGVEKPNTKEFISHTGVTPRGINYTLNKLFHHGILDRENHRYFISDPLLKYYLIRNR